MKMKKILLSLLLVFGSLNMFAQDGWSSGTSPITGEKWIMKRCINESGATQMYHFKVWKSSGGYKWTLCGLDGDFLSSVKFYDDAIVTVKKGNDWLNFFVHDPIRDWNIFSETRITLCQTGSIMRFENISSTFYLDLSGFNNAFNSLK